MNNIIESLERLARSHGLASHFRAGKPDAPAYVRLTAHGWWRSGGPSLYVYLDGASTYRVETARGDDDWRDVDVMTALSSEQVWAFAHGFAHGIGGACGANRT